MTIDEAIVQIKEIAKEKRNEIYTFGMHCNPKITKDLEMYEQLAEWLEELKALKQTTQMVDKSNFSQDQYKADTDTAYQCGYTKAIDDFAEALKGNVMTITFGARVCVIDRIAEQLKKGDADNE